MPKLCVEVTGQELNAINAGYAVGITRENVVTLQPPQPVVKRLIVVSEWGSSFEVVTVDDELFKVKQLTRGTLPHGEERVHDRPRPLNLWMNADTGSYRLWWNHVKLRRRMGTTRLQVTEVPLVAGTPRP